MGPSVNWTYIHFTQKQSPDPQSPQQPAPGHMGPLSLQTHFRCWTPLHTSPHTQTLWDPPLTGLRHSV